MQKSDSIASLAKALAAARSQFSPVKKDCKNPFFNSKYADLSNVLDAVTPALSKNGLALTQLVSRGDTGPIITSMLVHESGEWISEALEIPAAKQDAQGMGSATTYGRRYGAAGLLSVAAEDDDDGNQATWNGPQSQKAPKPKADPMKVDSSLITDSQRKRLFAIAHEHGWSQEDTRQLLGRHGFEASGEITKSAYDGIIAELESKLENDLRASIDSVTASKQ